HCGIHCHYAGPVFFRGVSLCPDKWIDIRSIPTKATKDGGTFTDLFVACPKSYGKIGTPYRSPERTYQLAQGSGRFGIGPGPKKQPGRYGRPYHLLNGKRENVYGRGHRLYYNQQKWGYRGNEGQILSV